MLRGKLALDDDDFAGLFCLARQSTFHLECAPDIYLAGALERFAAARALSVSLREEIRAAVQGMARYDGDKSARDMTRRLEALLETRKQGLKLANDLWTHFIKETITAQPPVRQQSLGDLLTHAMTCKGAAPKGPWLAKAKSLVSGRDRIKLAELMLDWIDRLAPDALIANAPSPSNAQARQILERQAWRLGSRQDRAVPPARQRG